MLDNLWDDSASSGFSDPELLLYRSNLLGSDLRITNFGGGNTSAKVTMKDRLSGDDTEVLWVKGSGGDLGSMELDGFATLYQQKVLSLKDIYRGYEHEDEMVGYYPHCTFDLNGRPASIDTPLHSFIPSLHVDHMHPDSVIAIAAAANGEELTKEIFGGEIGWLPWQRPGFDLGLKLGKKCEDEPDLKGLILGGHGLMTWGDTSKECYEVTLQAINRAEAFFAERQGEEVFGGPRIAAAPESQRRDFAAEIMPFLRGSLSKDIHKVAHFSDAPEILEFVGSSRASELAERGTSCPDHFLRTKIKPLFLDITPGPDAAAQFRERLPGALDAYREDYAGYYERCKESDSPAMRDPYPVVILLPGIGMITMAKDKPTARQACEFYVNAINVMRGATMLADYVGLDEREAFRIEYWALEEAKLQRMPPEKVLSRRVALVTGGGGGIGKATAQRLLREKACVVLTDIDAKALDEARDELSSEFGADFVRSVVADVTDEDAVNAALAYTVREYGGVDVLVCSAGLASSAPFEETSLGLWRKNIDVLVTGYFLAARAAYRAMLEQDLGGSIIFVASKNGLAASAQASAYCTAKAAELHLARSLALEGAAHGIRVNSVNPDAVLRGSKIWSGQWRQERADAYGTDDLEEHYRQRSLLKRRH